MTQAQVLVDPSVLDLAKSFISDKMDEPQIKSLSDDQRNRLAQEIAEGIHAVIEVATEHPDIALTGVDMSRHQGVAG